MSVLQPATRRTLVDILLSLPNMATDAGRNLLVFDWPLALRAHIPPPAAPLLAISALIELALQWESLPTEPPPLQLLVQAAQYQVRGSRLSTQITALLPALAAELHWAADSLADPLPEPPVFQVPYTRTANFGGRARALARLAALVETGCIPAVVGPAGIGKTQLAVEYAYQAQAAGRFPGGIVWLTGTTPAMVPTQVAALGGPDGWHLSDWDPGTFAANLARIRTLWEDPIPRLIIFDNCDDPALLREWRPLRGGTRMIVTARRMRWAAATGVRTLALNPLTPAASLTLLLGQRAHNEGRTLFALLADPGNAAAARAICAELGNLPLALALAGAYLAVETTLPLPDYYVRLAADPLAPAPPIPGTISESKLAATFALSYNRLDGGHSEDAAARRLLQQVAQAGPAPLPRALILDLIGLEGSSWGNDSQWAILNRLARLGLLEPQPHGTYRLPWLLATFVRTQATDPVGDHAAFTRSLLRVSTACAQAGYPLAGVPYLAHLRHVSRIEDDQCVAVLHCLARLLQSQGNYAAARPYLEQALGRCEQTPGPSALLIQTLQHLAALLVTQGHYATAQPLYERVLQIRQEACGTHHISMAGSLNALARVLQEQGDYIHAQTLYERALAIYILRLGPQHSAVATALNDLAYLRQTRGDYAIAQTLYERALVIRQHIFGPTHPALATSLNNLASLLQGQALYTHAEQLYLRALRLCEDGYGPTHPATASSLNNLAGLYQAQGQYTRAQPLYERALAIREQVLGPQHPVTASSLNNLAGLCQAQGQYTRAQPLYERALAIRKQVLGPQHPATANSLNNLAGLYQVQQQYAAAASLFEYVLVLRQQILGGEHPLTASSLYNLAYLCEIQGTWDRARQLYEQAILIRNQVLGPRHPDTVQSRGRLAHLIYLANQQP